ncbi:unknown [Firmicutes bacterium CAG:238]|nr:unknown [Firmicutes bacterium CAG:238]
MLIPSVRTVRVATTLSFAMKPVMSAVEILQSPKPSGANTGAITPASIASRLFCESDTTFSLVSNVCRHQITIVATKITVKALSRKSFAFSQSS